ncbi:hypothetical protein FCM35_KLT03771 [Carex littledalei]|uniref:Uncharacterized protein n=1 Tax=Carex littledalei TaxID=544730 RepID=A0A833VA14_9POAL|nr:hypothetical protein FCM35_KLT03771 [Carex littledalei]
MDSCLLTLGQAGSATSLDNLQLQNKENMPDPSEMDVKSKIGLNLDLNANVDEYNPFYPYKKLGLLKPTDPSECGSTTGPIEEENGPLKLWNQMKENGFLSSTQREIIAPKPRGRKPKRKAEETRKRIVHMQTEQASRFAKVAAPSGLLSGLNPGIINHVRNSKQVYSIIEAMVQSEKVGTRQLNKEKDPIGNGSGRFGEENMGGCKTYSELIKGYEECDGLKLGLSSDWVMDLGQSSSQVTGVTDDCGSNQEVVTSLSLKATSAASQWMELLQQDIKGRLAALRRSKKRVRNVISTELPYIISTELSCNQNNDPSAAHLSEKVCPGDHVEKWKYLFMQMDKALQEEGRFLENWLIQVQQMQSMCEKGLKYAASEGLVLGTISEFSKLKQMEAMEHEQAVKAAAASMYSTCNFVMNKEKVASFL